MLGDDYKFKPTVFVDDKLVSSTTTYDDFQTATDAATGIVDAEWSEGHSLEVFIDLMALRYDKESKIITSWKVHQLYHLKIAANLTAVLSQ